jgi:hypothetical protein
MLLHAAGVAGLGSDPTVIDACRQQPHIFQNPAPVVATDQRKNRLVVDASWASAQ